MALEVLFGLPLTLGYVVSSLVAIPLVTHGITYISRFQLWTQPVWVVLHSTPWPKPTTRTTATPTAGNCTAPFRIWPAVRTASPRR